MSSASAISPERRLAAARAAIAAADRAAAAARAEAARAAAAARQRGVPYRRIGELLGISHVHAIRLVRGYEERKTA
ncbi:hypothetical protein NLB33_35285 [Mycolicibacterium smegmatis]|uniref:hypothetical protein n=1 Tax=Mycolicibacterium smegmatis TaxID=1772 RepID=UPI0020A4DAAE|nr:hypothetical protein [Mycolicibacterium smegmatis]MCP2628116.1 hypothetical protein [Mycolicibacterium smegmatis]